MSSITFDAAQQQVDDWIKTYGVKYFAPTTNLGILMEEVGELSRHITRQFGEQSYRKDAPNQQQAKDFLSDEMADVLWVLLSLANQTGVNLTEAFQKNIEKKSNRDAQRHIENPKLK